MALRQLCVSEVDVLCPLCGEVFVEPVSLRCSHSVCESCLLHRWSSAEPPLCPVCNKPCSPEEPARNLAFSSLCKNFHSQEPETPSATPTETPSKTPTETPSKTPTEHMCPEHDEKLKIFCFEDKAPICVVCYTSKKHKHHQCAPIREAVEDLKSEMKAGVSGLLRNLETLNQFKADYETLAATIKDDRQKVENMLRQEFEGLRQFLREEEEARITALQEEETQKSERANAQIDKVSKEILNLYETVHLINQEVEMEDIAFLQNYANDHFNQTKNVVFGPDIISGIDTAKHLALLDLNLKLKMTELLQNSSQSLTLDPNTASNKLVVSENLSSVYYVEQKLEVPNNPERLYVGVLGSRGLGSGVHCWDVEVGDNDHWTIGVVKESVERKKLLKMDPSSGLWSIRFINGKYRIGVKSRKELDLTDKPRVIRVELDYDKGTVAFSDPSKGPVLYTFNDTFTEPLFPYFNTASIICPLNIT